MIKIKEFIPEDVCLACKGCCRYSSKETVWAPLFFYDEIVELTEANIVPTCLFTHPHTLKKGAARVDLVESGEAFICPCLDPASNRCKVYPNRPLDCRLYPFLLARQRDSSFLAVDENCPYIQKTFGTEPYHDYCAYLLEFLKSDEFRRMKKDNPEIVQCYPDTIKFLAPLE